MARQVRPVAPANRGDPDAEPEELLGGAPAHRPRHGGPLGRLIQINLHVEMSLPGWEIGLPAESISPLDNDGGTVARPDYEWDVACDRSLSYPAHGTDTAPTRGQCPAGC